MRHREKGYNRLLVSDPYSWDGIDDMVDEDDPNLK